MQSVLQKEADQGATKIYPGETNQYKLLLNKSVHLQRLKNLPSKKGWRI